VVCVIAQEFYVGEGINLNSSGDTSAKYERDVNAPASKSEDRLEAVRSFLEKRKLVYKDR